MSETREQAIERAKKYYSRECCADEFIDWNFSPEYTRHEMVEMLADYATFERDRIRDKVKAEISQEHANADTCCVRAMNNLLAAIEGEE